jgi:hypothetical protein
MRGLQWPVAAAAAAAGSAVRTAYKWLARHRQGGAAAMADRSSAPQHQPRRTPAALVAAIVAARQERLTAWAIAVRVQVPRSTVSAILARRGLNSMAALEPAAPVVRYERTRPGELVHLDIKPLVRILRPGHRIHGIGGPASRGPAGSTSTSRWMTTAARPTPKCSPAKPA